MSNRERHEATIERVLLRAGVPAILTWALIPLTFVLPLVDSTRAPYFDLTQTFSQLAYWLSQSGGKYGVPIVAVSMPPVCPGAGRHRRTTCSAEIRKPVTQNTDSRDPDRRGRIAFGPRAGMCRDKNASAIGERGLC